MDSELSDQSNTPAVARINVIKKFWIHILFFILHISVIALLLVNFSKVESLNIKRTDDALVEGVLLPKSNIDPNLIFNVDPLQTSTSSESILEIRKNISYLIFSTLFKEKIDGSLENDIVESYEFKNASELKLNIKQNIKWHDGKPLTTEDIKFTLNLIKALGDKSIFYGAINGDQINFEIINNFEMKIDLVSQDKSPRPNVAYLQELTFPILPQHLLSNYTPNQVVSFSEINFAGNPVGSGKLKYNKISNKELSLEKNEEYYGNKVKFNAYNFRLYEDMNRLLNDFKLKNVDIYTRKDFTQKDAFDESLNALEMHSYTSAIKNRRITLYINLAPKEESVLTKYISLRNNLPNMINRENILNAINNSGRQVFGPIDQSSIYYAKEMSDDQKYDPSIFTKRAEEIGFKKNGDYYEKDGKKLSVKLSYLEGELRNNIVEQIQNDFKQNGVEVILVKIGANETGDNTSENRTNNQTNFDIEEFNRVINNRDFELLLTTVSHNQDPDRFTEWHSSRIQPPGLNLSGLNSKQVDSTLASGRIEADIEKRKAHYVRFQNYFIQETPAIYLMNPLILTYHTSRIHNMDQEIINDIHYKYSNISDWEIK